MKGAKRITVCMGKKDGSIETSGGRPPLEEETVTKETIDATARLIEGMINGVGFVGLGAILVGKPSIRGRATAASLWASGAIGAAVGLGACETAIVLSIATRPLWRTTLREGLDGRQWAAHAPRTDF